MNVWRLNVRETQIGECIRSKKFALAGRPRNPAIQKDDILLLQLVDRDAHKLRKENARVEFALIFDHYTEDYNGSVSMQYWPNAGKTWRWILHCSDIIPTIPFSLDNLHLKQNYAGQKNPMWIVDEDKGKILPYIVQYIKVEEIGWRIRDAVAQGPSNREQILWSMIQNNDRIVEDSPDRIDFITVPEHKEIKRNPELPCILKEIYNFKCQICGFDFKPRYSVPYSETHHMIWLSRGGIDHSNNLVVICPNHHRIIHEVQPSFDRHELAFVYPNGLVEHLQLTNHFKDYLLFQKIEHWSNEREKTIEKERGLMNNKENHDS